MRLRSDAPTSVPSLPFPSRDGQSLRENSITVARPFRLCCPTSSLQHGTARVSKRILRSQPAEAAFIRLACRPVPVERVAAAR
jgi:hypothetical protein